MPSSKRSDEFLSEYRNLGKKGKASETLRGYAGGEVFYIPHLSVTRKDATITKLRNVFIVSSPMFKGFSWRPVMQSLLVSGWVPSSSFSAAFVRFTNGVG